jgi:hypothetical protein
MFLPGLLAKKEMAPRSNRSAFQPGPESSHTPIRPYTYAQPYLPLSLFTCGEAAEHTYSKHRLYEHLESNATNAAVRVIEITLMSSS